MDIYRVEQYDARLGRQLVHDERSRQFPLKAEADRSAWRDKKIRVYDPLPNPNQCHGECTGTTKAMQLNSAGSRKAGVVLKMDTAHQVYSGATHEDPWDGSWPPEDTGSSGLASAKVAQNMGLAGEYRWIFNGADGVVSSIMQGRTVSVGTWWYWDMFNASDGMYQRLPCVRPGGGRAGGHQYLVRGYDKGQDMLLCRTWWGDMRDFWIKRSYMQSLLMDGGDAHVQDRA